MWARGLLLVAITIGLTGCACSWTAVEPPVGQPSSPRNVPAVVATRDIPAGTQITPNMLTIQYFSNDQVQPYTFHSTSLVVGKYAAIPIHANQAIYDYLLVNHLQDVPRVP